MNSLKSAVVALLLANVAMTASDVHTGRNVIDERTQVPELRRSWSEIALILELAETHHRVEVAFRSELQSHPAVCDPALLGTEPNKIGRCSCTAERRAAGAIGAAPVMIPYAVRREHGLPVHGYAYACLGVLPR